MYCVYILFCEQGLPFYVGITKALRERQYRGWKRELGQRPYAIVCIAEHLTKAQALTTEAIFIAAIGRIPEGRLLNKSSYNAGMKGVAKSEEHRLHIKRALSGKPKSEKHRANLKKAFKHRRPPTEEHKARIRASMLVYNQNKRTQHA